MRRGDREKEIEVKRLGSYEEKKGRKGDTETRG